ARGQQFGQPALERGLQALAHLVDVEEARGARVFEHVAIEMVRDRRAAFCDHQREQRAGAVGDALEPAPPVGRKARIGDGGRWWMRMSGGGYGNHPDIVAWAPRGLVKAFGRTRGTHIRGRPECASVRRKVRTAAPGPSPHAGPARPSWSDGDG